MELFKKFWTAQLAGPFRLAISQLYASGHLDKKGIRRLVKEISAKKVFPVHTEDATGFKKFTKSLDSEGRNGIP